MPTLNPPDPPLEDGIIALRGWRTSDAPDIARMFQDPEAQAVYTTVERDVAFGLENLGVPRPQMRDRVEAALAAVGIEAAYDLATTEFQIKNFFRRGWVGAVIVELVQTRGGINVPPPEFLPLLRKLCVWLKLSRDLLSDRFLGSRYCPRTKSTSLSPSALLQV